MTKCQTRATGGARGESCRCSGPGGARLSFESVALGFARFETCVCGRIGSCRRIGKSNCGAKAFTSVASGAAICPFMSLQQSSGSLSFASFVSEAFFSLQQACFSSLGSGIGATFLELQQTPTWQRNAQRPSAEAVLATVTAKKRLSTLRNLVLPLMLIL